MAAVLLRLRTAELVAGFRGGGRTAVAAAARLAAGLALCAALWWGAVTVAGMAAADASAVVTVAGACAVVAFAAMALMAPPSGARDPRSFAMFALAAPQLASAGVAGRLLSIRGLVLVVGAAAGASVRHTGGTPAGWCVGGAVLGVLTCLLVDACCGLARPARRWPRRARNAGATVVGVLLGAAIPAATIATVAAGGGRFVRVAAACLAITPAGAAWAVPAGADGTAAWWPGWAVAVAVATVVVAAVLLIALVARGGATRRPRRPRGARRGWFAVMPNTAAGAIAARSLTYWLGERRYVVNMLIVPIAAAVAVVPLLVAGVPASTAALLPAPVAALFFGWLPHNDVSYDSRALWLHVAGAVRGAADRAGRIVPALVVGLPVVAVGVVAATLANGGAEVSLSLSGACAALLLGGLGISCIASATVAYPATHPGEGAFRQPQRIGVRGAAAQATVFLVTVAVSAPTLWQAWLGLADPRGHAGIALWAGLGTGVAVLAAGVWGGGAVFDRRAEALLELSETA